MEKEYPPELIKKLNTQSRRLRNSTLDMSENAGTGAIASSFSCAEIMSVLYGEIMRYDPQNPESPGRDSFILDKGHASPIHYATLADCGFFPKKWLNTLCQKDGRMGLHGQKDVPGIETSSGSIGHGLGTGAGVALAAKMDKRDYCAFVLVGDGGLYEGSFWESAMFASHNKLNNLIAIIDRNHLCAYDFTEKVVRLEPIDQKLLAFGWDVEKVDGHSIKALLNVLHGVRDRKSSKPYAIIADTIKGKGSQYLEGKPEWHTKFPHQEEIEIIRREINSGEDSNG